MKKFALIGCLICSPAWAGSQAVVADSYGNSLVVVYGGQAALTTGSSVALQSNPSNTAQIYATGAAATGLQISGGPTSGGLLYLGLPGDTVSVNGKFSVNGGTAPVGVSGAAIAITAQSGSGTNVNGGNINLTPGAATGTGTAGVVDIWGGLTVNGNLFGVALWNNTGEIEFGTGSTFSGQLNGGSSGISIAAGGTGNGNINITPAGSGQVVINGGGYLAGSYNITGQLVAASSSSNYLALKGAVAGSPPQIVPVKQSDTNVALELLGIGSYGVLSAFYTSTVDPTTSNIPSGLCTAWYNSTTPSYKYICNVGGTLRSASLN